MLAHEEFYFRRNLLLRKIPASSILILPGGRSKIRNQDVEYPFRQESNFYYLTGFVEPEAVLVLTKNQSGDGAFILFCEDNDPKTAIWTGPRLGVAGAEKSLGADKAYSVQELEKILPVLLENTETIVYSFGLDVTWDKKLIEWVKVLRARAGKGAPYPKQWLELLPLLDEQRLIKSDGEIALMRKAAAISAAAHLRLMQYCKPGKREYELEAEFIYEGYRQGCRSLAYPCIVGGGANACILHYTANKATLQDKELVLVDAGVEYEYYASDITRTFPVNGKFTEPQRLLYELVLKAQVTAIQAIKPGIPWSLLQEKIVGILVNGLVELGILKGKVERLIQEKAYQKVYMHSSGHWLGLDVHDVGSYKVEGQERTLVPGMVLTVEPGLYISPTETKIEERWKGMGIRIEDDILVTETGYEVLSKGVPKTVAEIEELMSTV